MKSRFGKKIRIISAIEKNDFRLLAHLLNIQNHPPGKPVDKLGNTILQIAVAYGYIQMAQFIIATYGLDIKAYNTDGMNSMHLAVCGGHLKMVKWLEQQGVDTESKTLYYNRTAYEIVCEMIEKNKPRDSFMYVPVMTPQKRKKLLKIKNYLKERYFESHSGYEIRKFIWVYENIKLRGVDFGVLPKGVIREIAEYI